MQKQTTTLATTPTQTLLRITTTYDIGGKPHKCVRYEWWLCNEAMKVQNYGGGGKMYCSCRVGLVDEAALVERFKRRAK